MTLNPKLLLLFILILNLNQSHKQKVVTSKNKGVIIILAAECTRHKESPKRT